MVLAVVGAVVAAGEALVLATVVLVPAALVVPVLVPAVAVPAVVSTAPPRWR